MKVYLLISPFLLLISNIVSANEIVIEAAKVSISYELKDPDSSKFRNVKVIQTPSGIDIVCGQINGKNSYGAYNGYTDFYYLNDTTKAIRPSSGSTIVFDAVWNSNCKE